MTEKELLQDIKTKSAAYETIAFKGTVAEVRTAAEAVKQARIALSEFLSKGAIFCPTCERSPIGMQRTPLQQVPGAFIYEVGCTVCGVAARGVGSAAQAVEAWNNGEYIQQTA
jgi:hypothetical protein